MTEKITYFYITGWDKLSPDQREMLTKKAITANGGTAVEGRDSSKITASVAEFNLAWDDETLEAEHWFSMPDVAPTDAAMLLCQYNPNETTFDDAVRRSNPETGPRELIQLKQRFEAIEPERRSLLDWLEYARSQNIKHHSWINRYAEARPAPALTTATPAPVGTAKAVIEKPPYPAIKKEGFLLKRKALVKKYEASWPDIVSDLNHASVNGLSKAAKGTKFGDWFESAALAWADQRGKRAVKQTTAATNSMFTLTGKKYTNV